MVSVHMGTQAGLCEDKMGLSHTTLSQFHGSPLPSSSGAPQQYGSAATRTHPGCPHIPPGSPRERLCVTHCWGRPSPMHSPPADSHPQDAGSCVLAVPSWMELGVCRPSSGPEPGQSRPGWEPAALGGSSTSQGKQWVPGSGI